MIPFIEHWVSTSWLAFTLLWVVAAFTSKRTVQVQSDGSRLLQAGVVLIGVTLLFNLSPWLMSGWLTERLTPESARVVLGGAVLTVAGMLFSVWARLTLGRNWSGTVTIKQDHELIQRGPYRIVRHPIYTGMLLAMLGTAFIYGIARCFLGVPIVGLGFWLKVQIEEQFMVQQFGEQYVRYRQEVRALIPYIL
ncbi:MAG TPA: isoprenylcysteine carboxylmethyltransferase family protein [Silvibacterium sp.]|nr:isoprenylcysteine carboxylmethyltransferase family protein [Silvibacterium sp.]